MHNSDSHKTKRDGSKDEYFPRPRCKHKYMKPVSIPLQFPPVTLQKQYSRLACFPGILALRIIHHNVIHSESATPLVSPTSEEQLVQLRPSPNYVDPWKIANNTLTRHLMS
jgi:hypothetical protein